MEDWDKELWKLADTFTFEVERLFAQLTQSCCEWLEELEEVEGELVQEIEKLIENTFSPVVGDEDEIDRQEYLWDNWNVDEIGEQDFLNPKIEANSKHHPACIGCSHYHGRVYSGNLLVCGMHPYGWSDWQCPDWEG